MPALTLVLRSSPSRFSDEFSDAFSDGDITGLVTSVAHALAESYGDHEAQPTQVISSSGERIPGSYPFWSLKRWGSKEGSAPKSGSHQTMRQAGNRRDWVPAGRCNSWQGKTCETS